MNGGRPSAITIKPKIPCADPNCAISYKHCKASTEVDRVSCPVGFGVRLWSNDFSSQQPSGDTPGVAAAPVALAGANVPGVAKLIVVPSAHAAVFGVGTTPIVGGSMLVPPSPVIAG
jgi:hypothetical protein